MRSRVCKEALLPSAAHLVHPPRRKLRSHRNLIEQPTFYQAIVTTRFAQVYGNRAPLLAGIDQAPVLWQQSPVRGHLDIEMSRGLRLQNVTPRNGDTPARGVGIDVHSEFGTSASRSGERRGWRQAAIVIGGNRRMTDCVF
jgi:hypothetical protein